MTAGRHASAPSRQTRAARTVIIATAAALIVILVITFTELTAHGFRFFVFRDAGTGATNANAPPFSGPTPSPVPGQLRATFVVPEQPKSYYVLVVPALQHHPSAVVTITVRRDEFIDVLDSPPKATPKASP